MLLTCFESKLLEVRHRLVHVLEGARVVELEVRLQVQSGRHSRASKKTVDAVCAQDVH